MWLPIPVIFWYNTAIFPYFYQWYFSIGNDYENSNTLTVVDGNENDVDFQNENIKIKTSYKTYKNENISKENKK